MKRTVAAALVLTLLTGMTWASASEAGSSSDPLVSKSYVDGEYTKDVMDRGQTLIDSALGGGTFDPQLDQYSLADGYTRLWVPSGGSIVLGFGASAILVDGAASCSVTGTAVNVTTGKTVASGSLVKNNRYFCAEDSTVNLTSGTGAVISVDGRYLPSESVTRALDYADVSAEKWYYSAAAYIYNNELYHDYESTKFRPDDPTTRAELVYALWVLSGKPQVSTTTPFSDVTEQWSVMPIAWAQSTGIVNGYGDGRFGPDDSIERQAIAAIMYRYAKYMGRDVSATTDLAGYTDVDEIGQWAMDAVKWANSEGLIKGTSETLISPMYTAARCQVAAIIMRFNEN